MPKERTNFRAKLSEVPHKPGVYVMRDRLGRIIYVGKARNLRKRLAQYFTPSRQMRADLKTRALLDTIWDFEWHIVRSDAEAVLFEGRLIKEYRPRYNISFRDDKRFLLVKVNLNDPYPRFQLTRLRMDDGARYFGPFAQSTALRSTLNAMKKRFGLRSCSPRVPTEKDYRHCLDHVIKNCSAPCIGKITQEAYYQRVLQACEFLDGKSKEMIESVEKEMHEAAARLDFEKATALRNLLNDLRATTKPMTRFTRKSLPSTINEKEDLAALQDALHLKQPPRIMECFDISNITSTHIVASMVRFRDGVPDRSSYRKYRIRTVKGQDDFASMAEVVRRRYSRVLQELGNATAVVREGEQVNYDPTYTQESPGEIAERLSESLSSGKGQGVTMPDLIIVDGGKGQLSMACQELQRLGLYDIPIIGLAKEFEEIYRPNRPLPLQLPADSGALRLLQRIRDEAHRVANSYHSLLLKKRISESALDEVPGISEKRKRALLAAFGSIDRIRRASIEDLEKVPGITKNLAKEIVQMLEKDYSGNKKIR